VNFTWHPLHKILTNPLYAGMIRHNRVLYPGQHEAIIDPDLFAEVQDLVVELAASERARRILAYPVLLKGIIYDMAGERLYATHTRKGSRYHRYYVSAFLVKRKNRTEPKNRMRIAASTLEGFVIRVLGEHLRDPEPGSRPYCPMRAGWLLPSEGPGAGGRSRTAAGQEHRPHP
jgi:site-specific DNA recombinase